MAVVINHIYRDRLSSATELHFCEARHCLSSLGGGPLGRSSNGTIIGGCWGETEGTKSSSSDADNDGNLWIATGIDAPEGTKSVATVVGDIQVEGNLSNGITGDDGSGAADGTKSSSSTDDADAGNLCTDALIDDGSSTMEGTKSLPSVDVHSSDLNSGAAEGTKSRSLDDGDRLG